MPKFNESYRKVFIGTKLTTANPNQTVGFLTTAGLGTNVLPVVTSSAATTYSVGSYGFFIASTWKSATTASIGATAPNLVLAAASLQLTDEIGNNFQGGFKESNKSKDINVKYVESFQKYVPCASRQQVLHIGRTKYTGTLSPTVGDCTFDFLCGEDYNLRIEIRGTPAYRYLSRNIYRLFNYNSGCCPVDDPTAHVDGTLAMIEWAKQIVADPEIKDMVYPIVYSEAGAPYYPPGNADGSTPTWDNYTSPGHAVGYYAGLRLLGAYVDTRFGNCSFQTTDYYGKVPLEIMASMVDFNGDPCTFTGICAITECGPFPGTGFGETILREDILAELYRQNNFPDDIRMREIEMGSDILAAIDRTAQYYIYSITHKVPRYLNVQSTFSEETYTNWIITNGTVAELETFMATWLSNGGSTVSLETFSCGTCTPLSP